MMSKQIKWGYLLLLSLIWGSSFILIKKGLVGLTAFQLGSLRIIFAALFLLVIGFRSLVKIPHHQWKYIALTSLFGTFIPAYLFAIAQTQIDSSISSILNSLTPLNTLLIWNGAVHHPNQNYYYAFLVLIASICYATNVNLIKKYLSDLPPLSITTGNFLVLLFPALAVLYSTDFFAMTYGAEVQESVLYILILGVLGTGIANIIFFKLIQISSPVFATSVTYLIPVVAFFWGMLDQELLTPVQLFGAFIVLIKMYLSTRK